MKSSVNSNDTTQNSLVDEDMLNTLTGVSVVDEIKNITASTNMNKK